MAGLPDDLFASPPDSASVAKSSYVAIPAPTEKPEDIVACLQALKQNMEMLTKQSGGPEVYAVTFGDLVRLNVLSDWVLDWLNKPK